jgi:hypothetical protein
MGRCIGHILQVGNQIDEKLKPAVTEINGSVTNKTAPIAGLITRVDNLEKAVVVQFEV